MLRKNLSFFLIVYLFELLIISFSVLFLSVLDIKLSQKDLRLFIFFYSFSIIVFTLKIFVRFIKNNKKNIFSPLSLFFLSVIIYHGFGTLVLSLGNQYTLDYFYFSGFHVSTALLLKVLFLVSIGVFFTMIGLIFSLFFLKIRIFNIKRSKYSIKNIIVLSSILSIIVKYFLIVPYMLDLIHFVLPGFIFSLEYLPEFVIFLSLWKYNLDKKKKYLVISIIFTALEVLFGLIVTSKIWMLLPFLIIASFIYYTKNNLKILFIFGMIMLLIFYYLTPFILAVRNAKSYDFNSVSQVLKSVYLSKKVQWGWLRLNYVKAEAFSINLFDEGNGFESIFEEIKFGLVPRIIYSEKPVNDIPRQFSYLFSGNYNNNVSAGVFAEGYLNYGWLGVVLVSFYVGFALGFGHKISRKILDNNIYEYMYLLITIYYVLGKGIVEWFASTYVIAIIFYLIHQLIIVFLLEIFGRKN